MMATVENDRCSSSSSESLVDAIYNRKHKKQTGRLCRKKLDIVSSFVVVASVACTVTFSVPQCRARKDLMERYHMFEFGCSIFFIAEYVFRVASYRGDCRKYMCSQSGIIDLIVSLLAAMALLEAVLPNTIRTDSRFSEIFEVVSCMRTIRMLKLMKFLPEFHVLTKALHTELRFILVFLMFVFLEVLILGSLLYAAERGQDKFNSIPWGMWWAAVTITTVGYGDLVPTTVSGKIIAAFAMLTGYGVLAVPSFLSLSQMMAIPATLSKAVPLDTSGDGVADSIAVDTTGDGELDDVVPFDSGALFLPVRATEIDSAGRLRCSSGHALLQAALEAWLGQQAPIKISDEQLLETSFQLREPRQLVTNEILAHVTCKRLDWSRCQYNIQFSNRSHIAVASGHLLVSA